MSSVVEAQAATLFTGRKLPLVENCRYAAQELASPTSPLSLDAEMT